MNTRKIFFIASFLNCLVVSVSGQIKPKKLLPDTNQVMNRSSTSMDFLPQLPNKISQSPQVEALTRFGDYPVGYNTGIVDMTVPLYEIKSGSLKIPIEISFHASGRKADETNGLLGMRWALNCGSLITRTVYGRPDEYNFQPYTPLTIDPYHEPSYSDLYQSCPEGYRGPSSGPVTRYDSEFDVFRYVLPSGKQGKFILKNVNGVKKAMVMPYDALKIETVSDPLYYDLFNYITITDSDGIMYKFGSDHVYLSQSIEFNAINPDPMPGSIPTSWYLKSIISGDLQDTISFEYTKKNFTRTSYSMVLTTGDRIRDESVNANFHLYDNVGPELFDLLESAPVEQYYDRIEKAYEVPVVTEIRFKDGSININYTPAPYNNYSLINEINVVTPYRRKIKFNYDSTPQIGKFTFLNNVEIKSLDGESDNVEARYRFNYYDQANNVIPSYYAADWWGYYNNAFLPAMSDPHLIPLREVIFQRPLTGNVSAFSKMIGWADTDREPNDEKKAGMLQSIEYPTGGKREFEYESNSYDDNGLFYYGPGLRIKQVKTTSNNGNIEYKKFKYGLNENGRGHIAESMKRGRNLVHEYGMMIWWDYFSYVDANGNYAGTLTDQCGYRIRDYSADPIFNYQEFGQSYLDYAYVNEYSGSEIESLQKTSFEFSSKNFQTKEYIHSYDVYPIETPKIYVDPENEWEGGKMLRRSYLKKNVLTGQYEMVKDENFVYERVDLDFAWDMPVYRHITTSLDRSTLPNTSGLTMLWNQKEEDYNDHHANIFGYGFRKYTSGIETLHESTEHIYNGGRKFTTFKHYDYEPQHLFLKSESTLTSEGRNQRIEYVYPFETEYSTTPPYNKLVEYNIIEDPIKKSLMEGARVLKSKRTSYREWSNRIILPEDEYFVFDDKPEELRIKFHDYDSYGNVKSVSKVDGPKVIYMYSYKGEYPIAKIENSEYSIVESLLGGPTVVNDFRNLVSPTDQQVKDFLVPLRPALGNALVSTYTYKPLIGMTSETDAKGMTTYYEYDNFQRIKRIRDSEGNIKQNYDYNFKP